MKIILEFKTKFEHDKYVQEQSKLFESITGGDVSMKDFNGLKVPDYSRRKGWSQLELEFVKEHYISKKIPWIAKNLRRKPTQVYMILNKMYKQGLPKKRPVNGEIEEDEN